ncbi:MAG: tetratricopeptide repeat protein [Polyangiaceae bacterium]
MRSPRARLLAACLVVLGATVTSAVERPAYADFEVDRRGKKKPTKPTGQPSGNNPQPSKPSDGDKGHSPEMLIARYTGIVIQQPGAAFPLQRLAQLYRERDGNLNKLVEDFEKRAAEATDDGWAAKVALAGIYKQDGRYDDAIKTYEAAIADKPKNSAPLMALAQLKQDRGDTAGARATYEQALPLLKESAEIEQTTRTLMGLALDLKDYDGAKKYHESLVAKSQGSLFVKAELGQALLNRQEYERAEGEFRELVKAASGDNRAMAPALRDLGSCLTKEKKLDEAVETLKKALDLASGSAGIRAEIMAIMTDAFRAEGKLAELVVILEKEQGQDFHRLSTLGGLYEETGQVDKAIATYKKAIALDSSAVDVRIRLVHLLQTAGELDEAIKEYEALVKAAPQSPEYVFELCETLIQRGDRPRALTLLKELEGRSGDDGDVLASVADFYERVEEKEKAMAVLQRLAGTTSGDPTFLIDLGDRYFQAGDKKKALDTWAKVKPLMKNEAKAAYALGQVYLDHDMPEDAITSLREAVQLDPNSNQYKKGLALALERTAAGSPLANDRFGEAITLWQELLQKTSADTTGTKKDESLAREARTHIVSLWSVTKELPNKVAPLKERFEATPPDLEAGRLLAEVDRKLLKLTDAEAVLRKIIEIAPGDQASMLALERVCVQEQNLQGAIDVLQKLAEADTKGARQYYQRMAQYAAELYHDDDAIKYAAKAVELSPEDAGGHQKLGDMYKKRQDYENAIAQYRQAIARNDRLFPVYFELAELLLTSGKEDEADLLFRKVVRSAPDEELVTRAARMSMQINLGKNSLETLERDLLPVAVGNPHKPIYRRMLVELYGAMTLPLVQKIRQGSVESSGTPEVAKAREELRLIGTRAVKPLLDALADDRESQQRVAIEVLAYVDNKNAGPSLFNFAVGNAEKSMRVRAMVACGALRDDSLLDKLTSLLVPKDGDPSLVQSDEIAVAAAWGIARIPGDKAEKVLVRLLDSPSPDVRAVSALGLGMSKNKGYVAPLLKLASSQESGSVARSAALLGLGELLGGAAASKDSDAVLTLATSAMDSADIGLRRAGLLTAARLSMGKKGATEGATVDALAAAVFTTSAPIRETAVTAGAMLFVDAMHRSREPLFVPDGPLRVDEQIASFAPDAPTLDERMRTFVAMEKSLDAAAAAAVATSPARALAVASSLRGAALSPFLREGEEIPASLEAPAKGAVASLKKSVVLGFVALARHPDVEVRAAAVETLGGRTEAEAQDALIEALSDPDDRVRRAALGAIAAGGASDRAVGAVAKLARESPDWALRVRATDTLGDLGTIAGRDASQRTLAVDALTDLAKNDAYALVREASVKALATIDPEGSRALFEQIAGSDAEPRVRDAAKLAAQGPTAKN